MTTPKSPRNRKPSVRVQPRRAIVTAATERLTRNRTTVTVAHPELWSPTSPNLYGLTLAIGQEASYWYDQGGVWECVADGGATAWSEPF